MYDSATMDAIHLAEFVAAGLFMLYLQRGRNREGSIRCTVCGSRVGEKHHKDCHYKDRL